MVNKICVLHPEHFVSLKLKEIKEWLDAERVSNTNIAWFWNTGVMGE
jgi:hypothetical protein